jgi:quercetin dioxygenase-like cupin family protein
VPRRYAVRRLEEIPVVPESDTRWYPLQHHFGLNTFGANVFVATAAAEELIGEHDEAGSGQQELYVVLTGAARFTLDAEQHDVAAVGIVAVPEPSVVRHAVSLEPGTTLLAVGSPSGEFRSTWRDAWFESVPKA